MKIFLKWLALMFSLIAVSTGIVLLLAYLAPEPPLEAVTGARIALSRALSERAESYAGRLYSEAQEAYDSAISKWQSENRKFIYFRNYESTASFAERARKLAEESAVKSVASMGYLKEALFFKIDSLNKRKDEIELLFGRHPFSPEMRRRLANGKMLLTEGYFALADSDYITANLKVIDAGYLFADIYNSTVRELEDYFRSYPDWNRQVQAAVATSERNGNIILIVDKMAKKCYIYSAGSLKREFDVELGRNWIGTKRIVGDKATPEGTYRITRKFQGNETLYHKSLALDYPNADDKARFKNDIAEGLIPPSSGIGGGIELHGGGGRGVDWTDGCIAFTDADIDTVFALTVVGTQVTIVGSARTLNEILHK